MTDHLFCFGFGFSARALARHLDHTRWKITGTSRSKQDEKKIADLGATGLVDDGQSHNQHVAEALQSASHALVSAGPDDNGDPLLNHYRDDLARSETLRWIGYLSTIGVYGDQNNAWVDEETKVAPTSTRAIRRVKAENTWREFAQQTGIPVQIFRLAGIYGSGRSVIEKLQAGTARRIEKPGQVFNRIHVDDIAVTLKAAMTGAGTHSIYNVTDDKPAPPQDVICYGAKLLGITPPPIIPIEQANLSPMGRSFYSEQRRVRNTRIKADLGVELRYPTYREGLAACLPDPSSA